MCVWLFRQEGHFSGRLDYSLLVFLFVADLKLLMDLVPVLIAVTGRAWTDRPVVPDLSKKPAVIARVRQCAQLLVVNFAGERV